MTKTETAVIVFMKNELLGHAKSRIASSVGEYQALDIYRTLVARTAEAIRESGLPHWIHYSEFIDVYDRWRYAHGYQLQCASDDLGERMSQALEYTLGRYDRAIIIGTDCPALTGNILKNAAAQLDDHEVVLGSSADGGFYLLGVRQWQERLFEEVVWSTDAVADQIKANARRLDWRLAELPMLTDIDHIEDWQAWTEDDRVRAL